MPITTAASSTRAPAASSPATLFTGDTFGISYREFDTAAGPWLFAPTTPVAFG